MANYDVTQATDNGLGDTVGTLSWAILQANTDGETLNSGNVSGTDDTITLQTNVQIDGVMLTLLNSNIEIIGNGFTIDGDSSTDADTDGDFRPLFVKSGTVTISNLTIANGLAKGGNADRAGAGAGMGGGLFIYDGDVALTNVTFNNNQAIGGSSDNQGGGRGGGGMFGRSNDFGSGGLFANYDSDDNDYGGNGNYGGGNGRFGGGNTYGGSSGRSGGFGGGGTYGGNNGGNGGFGGGGGAGDRGNGGRGGFGGGGSASIQDGSSGSGGFGGGSNGNGGGAGMGGAVFVRSGTLNIVDSVFEDNSASGGTGSAGGSSGQGLGGAIFAITQAALDANPVNQGEPGTLPTVTTTGSVTFSNNTAADATSQTNTGTNGVGASQDNKDIFGTITEPDTTAPTLTNFTRQAPTNVDTDADALTFRAIFDEAVQNVDAADFVVNGTTASISGVSGSGTTWDITVDGGDLANLNGTVSLDLAATQNITDLASNALPVEEPATDEAYILSNANTAPTLTGNTTLTAINEDVLNASNPGTTVAALLANAGITASDTDLDPLGIAVTSVDDTNGTWQYSTDGGTTWADFGTVNNNNVVTLGATSIYNGFDTTDHGPDDQGYLAAASVILGTPPTPVITETEQTVGVTVDTTANKDIYAGYSNHTLDLAGNFSPVDALPGAPDFPNLDSTAGYTLSFNAQVVSEVVETGRPRAGFSIIVVSQDTSKAVELAFQEGQIFAQTLQDFGPPLNNQFVASTTDVVAFDTTKEVQYSLAVQGNSYTLSANGTAILTGTLQDYTAGNTNGAPNPYTTANFIFLGDNTTSARGEFRLNQIALETPTQVRFVPDADYAGDATLNFRAWDTTDSSANGETGVNASQTGGTKAFSATEATATITVNAVNDAPTLTNLNGDSTTFTFGTGAASLDTGGDAVVTDGDSANFDGGTLTVTVTNQVAAEDLLTLDTSGNVAIAGTTAGATVSIGGTVVGTLANAIAEGNDLVINLNDQATPTNLPTLLRALQYQNTETTTPTTTARTVQVTLADGDGGTSTASTVTVSLQTTPEINILGGGQAIADGDTTPNSADNTDFGAQPVSAGSQVNTFTIANEGSAALTLSGAPLVTLSDNTHFTVTAQPGANIAAGGNSTFDITFDPAAAGFHTTTVTVTSNDSDESTYTFDVTGYGTPFVVINEIDVDNPGTDGIEFIELYDGGAGNTALDGLVLVLYNGNGDKVYDAIDLDGQTTDANGYFVVGSAAVANVDLVEFTTDGLQNGADAVALQIGDATDFPNGTTVSTATVVDAIVYDTDDADDAGLLPLLNIGQPQVNENGDGQGTMQSLQRVANGSGGQRNTSSFITATPTPGAANLPSVQFTQDTFITAEDGGTSTIVTVTRGSTQGTASVQVNVQPGSTATAGSDYDGSGLPATVNFANGEGSKTVAIPITDDATVEGDEILVLGLSNPTNLTLGDRATATLTITDNDGPGFTVVESGGTTTVDESGTTDTFTVVLNSQPLTNVELTVTSDDTGEATVDTATLTFTNKNWNQAQTVTITGVDDAGTDGTQTSTITLSVNDAASDDAFDSLLDKTVTVSTTDNDVVGITLVESEGTTAVTEGGPTDSYTVVLDTQPTDTVTVDLSPDSQTTLDQTILTFTAKNWDTAQTVTVTAVDDSDVEGAHTSAISHTVSSTDKDYSGLSLADITVAVTDNDVQAVNLAVSAASGSEADATAITVTVTAAGAVTGDQIVNLGIAGSNLTAGDYTLSTPTITILDGQTTGTATFTIVDDDLIEGTETAILTLSNPSAGLTLGGVSSQAIAIEDNDRSANPVFTFAQFAQFQAVDNGQLAPSESAAIGLEMGGLPLTELFDETYYLTQNPDIAAAVAQGGFATGYDHFVQFGINEGRNPSVYFDEAFYRANNADVAAAIANGSLSSGLMHYLSFGHWENRDPSTLFDASDYLLNHPDVSAAVASGIFASGFEHFIEFGDDEGRLSTLLFEEAFYQQQNADVAAAVQAGVFSSGFEHFISFGQQEGRAPSNFFNESAYLNGNSDVAAAVQAGAFSSGFEHYALFGRAEGRVAV
ncbi:MAG: choice-of-anchor D domain-containing protein [Cyanobacteria bacterium P01_H01_bin.162]